MIFSEGEKYDECSRSVRVGVGCKLLNIFIMKPIFKILVGFLTSYNVGIQYSVCGIQ